MRRIATGLVLALALSVGACATQPIAPPSIGVAMLEGDTTLDSLYNKSAKAYLTQAPTMDPVLKAKVKPILQSFAKAVTAADAAEHLGNATDVATQVAAAMDLYGQVQALLKPTSPQ